MKEITQIVADYYEIPYDALFTRERNRKGVKARKIVMYITRNFTTSSTLQAGEFFDRDHATVIHAINTIEAEMAIYPSMKAEIERIEEMVFQSPKVAEYLMKFETKTSLKPYIDCIKSIVGLSRYHGDKHPELIEKINNLIAEEYAH